jgi:hypothetical protein
MIFGASSSSQQMRFQRWDGTTLTNVLTLVGTGNVGIGTTSPAVKLDVDGTVRSGQGSDQSQLQPKSILFYNTASSEATIKSADDTSTFTSFGISKTTLRFLTGDTERARIDSSGNFGLNCSPRVGAWGVFSLANPSNGSSYNWGIGPDTAGALTVYTSSNVGVYLSYGATSWSAGSDERLKDIIEPISNAANKVSSLRAVIGKYKADAEGTRRSFLIAQDVQAVLPEAVSAYKMPDDETGYLGVRYTDLIPLLVASIKELTQRVAALESSK